MRKWFYSLALFIAVITVMGHTLVPHHHAAAPGKSKTHNHHHHHHGSAHKHFHANDEKQGSESGSNDLQNHPDEFGKQITKRSYFNIELPEQVIQHLDFFHTFHAVPVFNSRILHPPIINSLPATCLLTHSLSRRGPPFHA
jgi:hypothetical protein